MALCTLFIVILHYQHLHCFNMLHSIITALSLVIMWSENPTVDCQAIKPVYGCYYPSGIIVLGYEEPSLTLWHELGHALFDYDQEVKDEVSKLPMIGKDIDESVANYFEAYRYDENFSWEYPSLYNVFKLKLKKYEL